MPLAVRIVTRIQDQDDFAGTPTNGQVLTWVSASSNWQPATPAAGGVTSFNTRTGAVTLTSGDVTTALGFTPENAATAHVNTFNTRSGAVTLTSGDVTTALTFTPPPNTRLISAGTGLTGGGDLSADRTLTLALTSGLVTTALGFTPENAATAHVNTFNTRSGTVTLTSSDVTTALGFTPLSAPASPAQGQVFFYNGTNWVGLAPGISGQALLTQGAAANPIWGAPAADLSTAVILAPASSTRNVIQATGAAVKPFIIKAPASPTANQFEMQDSTGSAKAAITATGDIVNYSGGFLGNNTQQTGLASLSGAYSLEIKASGGGSANHIYMLKYDGSASVSLGTSYIYVNNTYTYGFNLNSNVTGGFFIASQAGMAVGASSFVPSAQLHVVPAAVGTKGLILQGMASQTGVLMELQQLSSTSTARATARIDAPFLVNTDASYTGTLRGYAVDFAGQREGWRVDSNGSAALLGFYGVAATLRQTAAAAATDAASTQALTNSLRTILINLGLAQ